MFVGLRWEVHGFEFRSNRPTCLALLLGSRFQRGNVGRDQTRCFVFLGFLSFLGISLQGQRFQTKSNVDTRLCFLISHQTRKIYTALRCAESEAHTSRKIPDRMGKRYLFLNIPFPFWDVLADHFFSTCMQALQRWKLCRSPFLVQGDGSLHATRLFKYS